MPTAFADLALHKPIRLSRAGSGASDSVIWSGIASAADLLRGYPLGDAENTEQARRDTAAGLEGVPVVSPEDHQAWAKRHAEIQQARADGREPPPPYQEVARGTVIAAALEAGRVPFRMSVHDAEYNRRIALPPSHPDALPDVSVAYEADIGPSSHPEADFAQLGRRIRHLALVPRGRDPHAHIVRDAFADGAPMTLAELKAKHPVMYGRCRVAIKHAIGLRFTAADAVSIDKAIPLIKELMADEVGKLVLHALVNAPAEMAELEKGVEEIDESPDALAQEPMMDKKAMADAITAATQPILARLDALDLKVRPIIERQSAADAAATEAALKTRATKIASAFDNAGIKRPDGFDPATPTAALCDAADSALVDALQTPRKILGAPRHNDRPWTGDGKRAGADSEPAPNLSEYL